MLDRFIDPPTPFDDLATWREFLAEMEAITPRTPEIEKVISEAKEVIASKALN